MQKNYKETVNKFDMLTAGSKQNKPKSVKDIIAAAISYCQMLL